ncbi:class I SAM-dependent methyltransferase [Gorillibacterium sp. sgz5001074]|uniref:class I SAM-dependent methyltransferase n=1 Tax=Gorillibacterium sp. sgz5001074 TaxID=3446695 RepID=UPI003F664CE3
MVLGREQAVNRLDKKAAAASGGLLVDKIKSRMAAAPGGVLRFRDYMEMCLYDPDGGYYTGNRPKVGREGDFYTSSHIGSVFGDVMARYIARLASVRQDERFTVTEWGGGTGRLAKQILDRIRLENPSLYARLEYKVVERSPHHQSLIRDALQGHADRTEVLENTPAGGYGTGLVFSNELLDAFPVHRIRQRPQGLMELYVGWDPESGSFTETELPCGEPSVLEYMAQSGIRLEQGQTADLNLDAGRWIREQAARMDDRTTLVTVDYGDVAEELFAPHRMAGTLMCYREHQAYDNPYVFAGEQDMTAHVDFSACLQAGLEAGLSRWNLTTQKQFLVDNGILEMLQEHGGADPFSAASKRNRAIRQLLLSDSMSELFKVLIQSA